MSGRKVSRGRKAALRWVAVMITVATAVGVGVSIPAASAAPKAEAPKATEVGVSPSTIKVAIVTDVNNQIVPGVLQGIVDGMNGWGRYVNAKGGIAGRKVEVDFIDSQLNPNEARNAVIQACSNDYALVGTAALLMPVGAIPDMTGCKDQAGAATGLPDIASLVTQIAEACAPVAFPFAPNAVDCSTVTQHPQTYRGMQGDAKYLLKANGNHLHGSYALAVDSPSVKLTSNVLFHVYEQAGIKADKSWQVQGTFPQSAYTPIIQAMKQDQSNYALMLQAVNGVVQERQEAVLQGLTDPKIVWECDLACYHSKVFTDAGSAVEGTYMQLAFLPFEETSSNAMNKNFVKYVGKDKLSGFASWGFTAGLEFQQAMQEVVAKNGVNGLTRANLLTALKNMTTFNAGGMIGTVNVAKQIPTKCFMLDQYKGGKFIRVYPKKPGTFDCKASNAVTFQGDYIPAG
jgi:ABC-type branched-subunit amino acid transport system substrate-binding protein